jgi:hypothetical protein
VSFCLHLTVSISRSVCLYVAIYIAFSIANYICLSIALCLAICIYLYGCFSVCLGLSVYIMQCVSLCLYLYRSFCQSLSVYIILLYSRDCAVRVSLFICIYLIVLYLWSVCISLLPLMENDPPSSPRWQAHTGLTWYAALCQTLPTNHLSFYSSPRFFVSILLYISKHIHVAILYTEHICWPQTPRNCGRFPTDLLPTCV